MGFNGAMARPPLPEPRSDSTEPGSSPPAPLETLKRWPDACRPDQPCEIAGTVYPAAESMDGDTVLWWIDFIQVRISAARSLVNNVVAATVGALFGASAALATLWFSETPWIAVMAALTAIGMTIATGWYLLHDAEHHALEQRWMLYRRRARQLGASF